MHNATKFDPGHDIAVPTRATLRTLAKRALIVSLIAVTPGALLLYALYRLRGLYKRRAGAPLVLTMSPLQS